MTAADARACLRDALEVELEALGWSCEELHNHRRFTRTFGGFAYQIDTNVGRYAHEFLQVRRGWGVDGVVSLDVDLFGGVLRPAIAVICRHSFTERLAADQPAAGSAESADYLDGAITSEPTEGPNE